MFIKSLKSLLKAIENKKEDEVLRYFSTPADIQKWEQKYQEYRKKKNYSYEPLISEVIYRGLRTVARTMIASNIELPYTNHRDHPFNTAIIYDEMDILDTLIEYNVPLSDDALRYAAIKKNTDMFDRVLSYGTPKCGVSTLDLILRRSNSAALCNSLIDHGFDFNDPELSEKEFLYNAVRDENLEAINFISNFPNLLKDDDAFHLLVNQSQGTQSLKTYLLLVEKGAEPEKIVFANNRTLLHVAASASNHAVMLNLIQRNINIDACDADGNTALHIAAHQHDWAAVSLLMEHGASPDILNKNGKKPADLVPPTKHISSTLLEQLEGKHVKVAPSKIDTSSATGSLWTMLGEDKIAHIETHLEINKKITDIFNFTVQERITVIDDLTTETASTSVRELFDASTLAAINAFQRYKEMNGTINEAEAFGCIKKNSGAPFRQKGSI